jgi:alpha-N-arabinofuranosidase
MCLGFSCRWQFFVAVICYTWLSANRAVGANETIVRIHAGELQTYRIPRNLTGKFCEHLGANIYKGMEAQILRNPTFGDYRFATGEPSPDGIATFQFEPGKIEPEQRRQAMRDGWPEEELAGLAKARLDGLACFWGRWGETDAVRVGPDTGPAGQRAQRIELKPGKGIKQWTWLPLHREREYEFDLLARSSDLRNVKLSVRPNLTDAACAEARIDGLGDGWQSLKGVLRMPQDAPPNQPYCVVLSADSAGQIVVGHLFLRPADHIQGADPDVIRLLKAARLPLLRWPGGNFVSAYHWRDGVGPVERRPTLPNYAWGGIEPNTFGTDEFIEFCRAVGCEAMICINGGTGTPEEAARWIEYCNGPVTSPMGALRSANGHPAPFQIRHWEVGNELWGRWQARWTTAGGYVDRYLQFARAMRQADSTIKLHACGAPVLWGKNWNDTLIAGAAPQFQSITDHPLIGGNLSRQTDPMEVYRDFMHVPDILEQRWDALRQDMETHGIKEPRLAVTELQMFAHLGSKEGDKDNERLTPENLVTPGTLAEALYDTLVYHAAVRLQPFVELVTHSATVNHGGGLRKERERVYANPCYYANLLFAEFAQATPVKTEVRTLEEQAPFVLPDIRNSGANKTFGAVDAVAAVSQRGDLLISLVHRGTGGPIRVSFEVDGFALGEKADLSVLSGAPPWSANTLEQPRSIDIRNSQMSMRGDTFSLEVQPFSVVQGRFFPRR